MSIRVTMVFNGECKIQLTATTELDRTLLSAALNNRIIKSVNPLDGGFEFVLIEKSEER